ncbi:hypothetical protein [Bacillus sp. CH140a_4T]|nr:hypothetical protein [Bacillus sp. CH140a_4T]
MHKKDGCYFLLPVTIMITGWSYPIENTIIMNGEVTAFPEQESYRL